jgi:hypothetical protein
VLVVILAAGFTTAAAFEPKSAWTLDDMPSQQGRIYLVTGGTSGIGSMGVLSRAEKSGVAQSDPF